MNNAALEPYPRRKLGFRSAGVLAGSFGFPAAATSPRRGVAFVGTREHARPQRPARRRGAAPGVASPNPVRLARPAFRSAGIPPALLTSFCGSSERSQAATPNLAAARSYGVRELAPAFYSLTRFAVAISRRGAGACALFASRMSSRGRAR